MGRDAGIRAVKFFTLYLLCALAVVLLFVDPDMSVRQTYKNWPVVHADMVKIDCKDVRDKDSGRKIVSCKYTVTYDYQEQEYRQNITLFKVPQSEPQTARKIDISVDPSFPERFVYVQSGRIYINQELSGAKGGHKLWDNPVAWLGLVAGLFK